MAVLTLKPSGFSGGKSGNNSSPKERGEIKGWSTGSARRNMAFLQSIDPHKLEGQGFSLTLTVKIVPASPEDWSKLTKTFVQGLQYRGVLYAHWVTEWTKKRRPHLHLVAYFHVTGRTGFRDLRNSLLVLWLKQTKHLKTERQGQHIVPISGFVGWVQYTSNKSRDRNNMLDLLDGFNTLQNTLRGALCFTKGIRQIFLTSGTKPDRYGVKQRDGLLQSLKFISVILAIIGFGAWLSLIFWHKRKVSF